jgi:hypothetical protein
MNMLFDPHHVNMELCYRLLAEMNLFYSNTQFVALHINGAPQGVYLLVEPHKDAIRRTFHGVMGIYRRRTNGFSTKYEKGQSIDRWHLNQLERVIRHTKGPELPGALNEIINLDAYLTWLAFNSILQNADSVDELFYIVVANDRYPQGRIEFMAWDYDDISKPMPSHPKRVYEDPLMFACENELDRLIQQSPMLYKRYKRILSHLINEILTPYKIRASLDSVRNDVDRFERNLINANNQLAESERQTHVEHFFNTFMARRQLLLTRLAEGG